MLGGIDVIYPGGEQFILDPGTMRAIDRFTLEDGKWTATSVKSVNVYSETYQRPGQLYGCLAHAVSDLGEALAGLNNEDGPSVLYKGDPNTGAIVHLDSVEQAALQIVVPPEQSADHWQQFNNAAELIDDLRFYLPMPLAMDVTVFDPPEE